MIRPELGSVAEELYLALAPFTERIHPDDPGRTITDEDLDWPLLIFFGTLARRWQQVDDLSRDTDDAPGWSTLVDLDRIPDEGLPYIAQFKGKTILQGMSPAEARARIESTDGFDRGSPDALKAAGKRHLEGNKSIFVNERIGGDQWQIEVVTYTDETPDPAQTFRDLLEQKPYGIILTHVVVDAWNYETLRVAFNDYGEVTAYYTDYAHLRDNDPPAPGT